MNVILLFIIMILLAVIAGLLHEVLDELRLAKRDREDAHSQRKADD